MKKKLKKSPYEGQGVEQVSKAEISCYNLETFLMAVLCGSIRKDRTEDMRDWLENATNGNKDELRHIYENIDENWNKFIDGRDKNPNAPNGIPLDISICYFDMSLDGFDDPAAKQRMEQAVMDDDLQGVIKEWMRSRYRPYKVLKGIIEEMLAAA